MKGHPRTRQRQMRVTMWIGWKGENTAHLLWPTAVLIIECVVNVWPELGSGRGVWRGVRRVLTALQGDTFLCITAHSGWKVPLQTDFDFQRNCMLREPKVLGCEMQAVIIVQKGHCLDIKRFLGCQMCLRHLNKIRWTSMAGFTNPD